MLRMLVPVLIALLINVPHAVHASDRFEPWSDERLAELRATGKPFLVDVFATWCGTCKRQAETLDPLLVEAEFAALPALRLDWDAQREQARSLGAPRQSTLILIRGEQRIALSVAETDPERLRAFVAQALR